MQPKNYIINRSWAEVNLDAIVQNIRAVRKMTWKSTEIMAVVKADAYGHGVAHVASTLLENGADRLAVSLIDEGIELRQMGIKAPILILSYSDPRRAHEIVKYRLTQTVYSWDLINALDEAAAYLGQIAPVHVKIDTGMGRVGLVAGFDSVNDIRTINSLPHVTVEGVRALQARGGDLSPTVLNQRLRDLREASLVVKGVDGYQLTALGSDLLETFEPTFKWAQRWRRSMLRKAAR